MSAREQNTKQQLDAYRRDLELYPTGHREVFIYKNLHIIVERMTHSFLRKPWDNWRGAVLYENEWINPKQSGEPFADRAEKISAMYETLEATGAVRIESDFGLITMPDLTDENGKKTFTAHCIGIDTLKLDDAEAKPVPELSVHLPRANSTYKDFQWMKQQLMRVADIMDQFIDSDLIH